MGCGEPTEHVLESLRAGAQIDERVTLLGQPAAQPGDHLRMRRRRRTRYSSTPTDVATQTGRRRRAPRGRGPGALRNRISSWPVPQLVERAVGDHLAAVEDDHPIGQPFGLVEFVGGEHHRAATVGELADDRADRVAPEHVDPRRRLVEERHLGPSRQREGERQPLLLAAAQPSPGGRRPVAEADRVDQLAGIGAPVVQRAVVANRVAHTRARVDAALLQHHAHAFAERALLVGRVTARAPAPSRPSARR